MIFKQSLLCLSFILLCSVAGRSEIPEAPLNTEDHSSILQPTFPLDRAQIETRLGRKLKFKEKIGLFFLKSKIEHAEKKGLVRSSDFYQPITDGFAIAGFVIGIVGLLVFGFLLGIFAVIFSAISLGRIRKYEGLYKGKGLAIAGLVMGIVEIAFWILIIALLIPFV